MNKRIINGIRYLFISLLVYLFIPAPVLAAGEFQAGYEGEYAVSPSGITIVTQNITLTNKLTNLYPKQYSILLDTTQIKNVIAYDPKGVIQPAISQKEGKTEILLSFNEQVVGIGKQLHFTLRFENEDIAKKLGKIWEITIPGVINDTDLESYFVSLHVPPTFGPNAYMSPLPSDGRRWNKQQMVHGGISAAYGTEQLFALDLSYFIENTTITPKISEIALPPDTAFQKVTITSLDPKPKTVRRDEDGNWLARYDLAPGEKSDVTAKLIVRLFLAPQKNYTDTILDPSMYIKAIKYWESLDPRIADLATVYANPRTIYEYVSQTLSYDYDRVNQSPIRKGALQALSSPKTAICMEFTDLFIAMARAAGIPAREVVGYAYTTNTKLRPLALVLDVLHAWPQYYDRDKKLWISIDPTWANTTGGINYFDKLDFNHIVFAIHGANSERPYPAGFYKRAGKTGKDVLVSFASRAFPLPSPKLSVSYNVSKTITAGFPAKGAIRVENTTGVTIDTVNISIKSSPIDLALDRSITSLPPFGTVDIPITLTIHDYLYRGSGRISVSVNGDTSQFYFEIRPSYRLLVPVVFLVGTLLTIVWFFYKKIPRLHR